MQHLVTILIATQNRPEHLNRLLEYYDGTTFPIIIADSSIEKHYFRRMAIHWTYSYTPCVNFTAKIEAALNLVRTPFVVICKDDHFILRDGIEAGVDFLAKHDKYISAQGYGIGYHLQTVKKGAFQFEQLASSSHCDISMDDPIGRLERRFSNYRSTLSAVHRTFSLKLAFRNAGFLVKDSTLAELLTAIVPVVSGKHKALPVFFEVCELPDSRKTGNNPGLVYRIEQLYSLINLVTFNLSAATGLNKEILKDRITNALYNVVTAEDANAEDESDDKKEKMFLNQFRAWSKNMERYKRKTEADFHFKKLVLNREPTSEVTKIAGIISKASLKETAFGQL